MVIETQMDIGVQYVQELLFACCCNGRFIFNAFNGGKHASHLCEPLFCLKNN